MASLDWPRRLRLASPAPYQEIDNSMEKVDGTRTAGLGGRDFFRGVSVGAPGRTIGEVVFNTAMTGYQEILTDPSYCRQIVTLTYPHIGNTGTNSEDQESERVFAAGLVIRDLPALASSWRRELDLPEFLRRAGLVAIAEIDTRKLTRILRNRGRCPVAS